MDIIIKLRHLKYFITVAEELHFGKAAKRLHMTQPPLSQQISQLEEKLGVKLLERTKRKTELTYAGRIFLEGSLEVLDLINQTIGKTQQAMHEESGHLTIGSTGLLLQSIVPATIRNFLSLYPAVKVKIIEMVSNEQLKSLFQEKIDLGFSRTIFLKNKLKDTDVVYKVFYKEPLLVALPNKHHLADSTEISISELIDDSFIVLPHESESCHENVTLMLCAQAGFKPKLIYEAIQTKTIVNLVAAGMGIAIVPASISSYQNTDVKYLPIKESNVQLETALFWRKSNKLKILDYFINVLFDTISKKVDLQSFFYTNNAVNLAQPQNNFTD